MGFVALILSLTVLIIAYKAIINLRRKTRYKIMNFLLAFVLISNIYIFFYTDILIYNKTSDQNDQLGRSTYVNNKLTQPEFVQSESKNNKDLKQRVEKKKNLQISLQKKLKHYVVDVNISLLFHKIELNQLNITSLLDKKQVIENEKIMAELLNTVESKNTLGTKMFNITNLLRGSVVKSIRSEKVRLKQRIEEKKSPNSLKNVVAEYEKYKNLTFK